MLFIEKFAIPGSVGVSKQCDSSQGFSTGWVSARGWTEDRPVLHIGDRNFTLSLLCSQRLPMPFSPKALLLFIPARQVQFCMIRRTRSTDMSWPVWAWALWSLKKQKYQRLLNSGVSFQMWIHIWNSSYLFRLLGLPNCSEQPSAHLQKSVYA